MLQGGICPGATFSVVDVDGRGVRNWLGERHGETALLRFDVSLAVLHIHRDGGMDPASCSSLVARNRHRLR